MKKRKGINISKKKRLEVRVSPFTHNRVKKSASSKGITMSEFVNLAIEDKLYLESISPSTQHKYFTLKDKKIISNRWKCEFADNGWMDWFCPDCDTLVWNDDVHVHIEWPYCPFCGNKIIEWEEKQ